jgi:hypothetical protein
MPHRRQRRARTHRQMMDQSPSIFGDIQAVLLMLARACTPRLSSRSSVITDFPAIHGKLLANVRAFIPCFSCAILSEGRPAFFLCQVCAHRQPMTPRTHRWAEHCRIVVTRPRPSVARTLRQTMLRHLHPSQALHLIHAACKDRRSHAREDVAHTLGFGSGGTVRN